MSAEVTIGLDIGGTKIEALALDERRQVLTTVRVPTITGAAGVLDSALQAVETVRERLRESRGECTIRAIGVGIPGVVDSATGLVVNAVNLRIASMELGTLLEARSGAPVTVVNDVSAAALGAAGEFGDAPDLAYINIGTGLAAGIVLDGRVRTGAGGAAGEVGHLAIDENRFLCACGQHGCLETVASGSALERNWARASDPGEPAGDLAQALLLARDADEPEARVAFARFATGVAEVIRVLCLTLDSRLIVIGGGMSALGDQLLTAVTQVLADWAGASAFLASLDMASRVRLLPAGTSVGALGAGLLVWSHSPTSHSEVG